MAKVLLVDDDDMVRATLKPMLESLGHQVSLATNGNDAIGRIRSEAFDIMLTDIIMPEKEGIEAIIEIRRSGRTDLKIIAMSGGGRAKTTMFLDAALKLGADAILAKPVSIKELTAAIARCEA